MGIDLFNTEWFHLKPRLQALISHAQRGRAAPWLLDEARSIVNEADSAIQVFRARYRGAASYELYKTRCHADYLAAMQLRMLRENDPNGPRGA